LMIEQYLKDSITEPDRKAKIEALSKLNLMPARIYDEIRRRDSLRHLKDTSWLLEKGYLKTTKDTTGIEDEGADDSVAIDKYRKLRKDDNLLNDTIPAQKNNEHL